MPRHFPDWLSAFIEFSAIGEAPLDTLFWSGVSTVAGALRRRVFIDQINYQYYSNHYVILVAPPGVISKTTTASLGHSLLSQVAGIKFGPAAATWQALISRLEEAAEEYQDETGDFRKQSALTIISGELGNLIDPKDRAMLDAYVDLWDSRTGWFEKATKTVESNKFANPWLNIIACTTPSWLSNHMPEYVLGGGFVSRCTFVFADEKRQPIAYPARQVKPAAHQLTRKHLIEDLEDIASMVGEMRLTEDAYEWGEQWYKEYLSKPPASWLGEHSAGYWVRKQAHLHKLAICLSASESTSRWITEKHLQRAEVWINSMEKNLHRVFDMIGRTNDAAIAEQVMRTIRGLNGHATPSVVKAMLMKRYGSQEVQRGIDGLVAAGQVVPVQQPSGSIALNVRGQYPATAGSPAAGQ